MAMESSHWFVASDDHYVCKRCGDITYLGERVFEIHFDTGRPSVFCFKCGHEIEAEVREVIEYGH